MRFFKFFILEVKFFFTSVQITVVLYRVRNFDANGHGLHMRCVGFAHILAAICTPTSTPTRSHVHTHIQAHIQKHTHSHMHASMHAQICIHCFK